MTSIKLKVSDLEQLLQLLRAAAYQDTVAAALPVTAMEKEHSYRAASALMERLANELRSYAVLADDARRDFDLALAGARAQRIAAKKQ